MKALRIILATLIGSSVCFILISYVFKTNDSLLDRIIMSLLVSIGSYIGIILGKKIRAKKNKS